MTDGGPSATWCRTRYTQSGDFALPRVSGSASVSGGLLCVTGVNAHPFEPLTLDITLRDCLWAGAAECVRLTDPDLHAHNTFGQPDRVALTAPEQLRARGATLRVTLEPGAIFRVRGRLA